MPDSSSATAEPSTSSGPIDSLSHPSFVGFIATQFFGAFNDNLFKQLLLLLAIPTAAVATMSENGSLDSAPDPATNQAVVAPVDSEPETDPTNAPSTESSASDTANDNANSETAKPSGGGDLQGIATVVFGLPFVLFGGLAGYLADRYSKRTIIVTSKVAEIVVMGLGLLAFLATPMIGFAGLWIVLFLMGLQSTFFGPGKYGIMPEMLSGNQLNRGNGLVLMTTFIAIIIGTAVAGPLKDSIIPEGVPQLEAASGLWIGSLVCVGIAVVGTITSLLIIRLPAADPQLKLKAEYLAVPKPMRTLLKTDTPLLIALLASCVFWLIAGLTIQAVNSLGKTQLLVSDTKTSLMVSLISVGIAAGGAAAGVLSKRLTDRVVIQIGMWGVVAFCALMAISLPGGRHLLGFGGSIPVLMLLGASAAFFAIPIQVFLQARPPEALKGRMIAVMNQANFFAIVMSGVLYQVLNTILTKADLPRSTVFGAMAVLFLPVAIFYRPSLERTSVETLPVAPID
ncbi:MFS transporter [Rhodopirellula halodulae]|uniref:MFS transporter n=1 Tax=Rhodopirellula halodulae TaxID=2894198 RepID=UPI001E5762AE|nr:MFS transporter [Rhodopirellula sp. JC737]MCC9654729.1 MFS transporter [Rhodopirellula sp. JC737]